MQIQMGSQVSLGVLAEAFNSGFQDYRYSTTFTPAEMASFLKNSGVWQENCAVLMDDAGARGVGAALLALEGKCAWCGGLAVAPEYRRGGWATRLMTTIEQRAAEQGCTLLSLEVLADNVAAGALYARLGYRRERELLIWERMPAQLRRDRPRHRCPGMLLPADAAQVLAARSGWHRVKPCWQRTAAFLARQSANMAGYLLHNALGDVVGYVLIRNRDSAGSPTGADGEAPHLRIMDMAVRPGGKVQTDIEYLLHAFYCQFPTARLSLVNEPGESPFTRLLGATGFQIIERQYEMRRRIG